MAVIQDRHPRISSMGIAIPLPSYRILSGGTLTQSVITTAPQPVTAGKKGSPKVSISSLSLQGVPFAITTISDSYSSLPPPSSPAWSLRRMLRSQHQQGEFTSDTGITFSCGRSMSAVAADVSAIASSRSTKPTHTISPIPFPPQTPHHSSWLEHPIPIPFILSTSSSSQLTKSAPFPSEKKSWII